MAVRKETVELTVEDKLKNLYELQKVLSRIDEIKIIRGELPLEVQDLEDEIAGMTLRISKMKDDLAQARLEITQANEGKLHAHELLEGYKEQLDNVSNNREYDGLLKEIEYQELDIELFAKKIRVATQKEKELTDVIALREQDKMQRIEDLTIKRQELEDIISENKAEEDRLREESRELEENIESRLLSAFKRIRKSSHNGLGVVVVERDSCGGCFAKIAPQRQLDVIFHKKVIVCEYCGRILIDPELAGILPAKQPAEEKKSRRRRATKKAE